MNRVRAVGSRKRSSPRARVQMELRSIIRGLIAVLGLGAVLALLYRLITQNKRLTHEVAYVTCHWHRT